METVTALTTTNFTEKHVSIADKFLQRVIAMIAEGNPETKTYGIDLEAYAGEMETIKLALGDKVQIQIQVTTRRN